MVYIYYGYIETRKSQKNETCLIAEEDVCPQFQCFMALLYECIMAPCEHPPPHFHVYYGEYRASVDIQTCELTQGKLPKKQSRLVIAWAELHQEELMANWTLLMNGEKPFNIQPLQ